MNNQELILRTNLSSQISFNKVSPRYYKPLNAVDRSALTCFEKIPTEIFETTDDGVYQIADEIEALVRQRREKFQNCVIGLGAGLTLRPLFNELIRRHNENGLSFKNVVIVNLYEYYPLNEQYPRSAFENINELFISHVDIAADNVVTFDATIEPSALMEYCNNYEQIIKNLGGLDITLLSIGREGNIAMNEPGSTISSVTRLILINSTSRDESAKKYRREETAAVCTDGRHLDYPFFEEDLPHGLERREGIHCQRDGRRSYYRCLAGFFSPDSQQHKGLYRARHFGQAHAH